MANDGASSRVEIKAVNRPEGGWMRERPELPYLVLFYFSYVAAGGLGQGLAIIPGISITFWPPAGLFVATLLLTARQTWPWWVLAGCLAELTCNFLWFHNPVLSALTYFAANALEALTAACLVTFVIKKPFRLESLEEAAAFVLGGAGFAPIVGATVIAATDHFLGKHDFWTAWPLVWLGDAAGLLISTPLALAAVQAWREKANINLWQITEATILAIMLVGIGILSFEEYLPTTYLIMPPLLWISARFRLLGAAAALALIVVLGAVFAHTERGAFAVQPEQLQLRIIRLQIFFGISAVSALIVAILSLQYRNALTSLRYANAGLETQVAKRTESLRESERHLSAVLEALPIGVALVDKEGKIVVGNEVFRSFAPSHVPANDDRRFGLWEGYDANNSRIERDNYPARRALRGVRVWPGQEFLFHGDKRRGPFWTRIAALPLQNADGELTGATVVISDVDQERRAKDERLRHEEHQAMLIHELNHRVKNTLASIQSMATQTLRTSPSLAEAKVRFEARLLALSKAHDVLTAERWEGALVHDIVTKAILPYDGDSLGRIQIKGPNVRVPPRFALALAMALHELCTNAVKYGALSKEKGHVTIAWSVTSKSGAPTFKLRWTEKGGPPVSAPSRRGFGTRLIERSLASELGGDVKISFARSGVICTVEATLSSSV